MPYAQKNYPQTQGINGRYPISAIGCFITAFCNLQEDFGYNVNPLDLNNWLVDHNGYVDVDDGVRDDCGWGTISLLDPNTQVSRTADHGINRDAGWPASNNSIVRFYYRSVQSGQMIYHFCKVADAANHIIIDSWDGQRKTTPYGEPTAWAEYSHATPVSTTPPEVATAPQQAPPAPKYEVVETYPDGKLVQLNKQPTNLWGMNYAFNYMKDNPVEVHAKGEIWTVTNKVKHEDGMYYYRREGQVDGFNIVDCDDYTPPVVQLPAAPVTAPSSEKYDVIKPIAGYVTATRAANHTDASAEVAAGSYWVFNKIFSKDDATKLIAINVTTKQGYPGAWVNPDDNVPDPPKASDWNYTNPVVTPPEPTPAPEPAPVEVEDYKASYVPFRSAHAEPGPRRYVTMRTTAFKDFEGKHDDITLKKPQEVNISGRFTKDNVTYLRPKKMADQGLWYGAAEVDPETQEPNFELYNDVYGTKTTIEERVAMETATITDQLKQFASWLIQWAKKLTGRVK